MTDSWKILEPIKLGSLMCRNRILMASHSYGYTDDEGLPTPYLEDYLAERAKGGIGLVIMGGTSVVLEGEYKENITYNVDNNIIPRYLRIADAVHKHGALVFDQLQHAGGQLEASEGVEIFAPSPVPHEYTRGIPVELTANQITHVIDAFVQAASRAKAGGLDGIELKGDQGFLIHQFLSPYYNHRTDNFGGSTENRFRFLKEIIGGIRDTVGSEFVVGVRITGDAMVTGDLTLDDSIRIAQEIEKLKQIDYIHVNGATNSSFRGYLINHGDSSVPPMNFAHLAKEIKKVVNIPIILASMILHPNEAEHIVNSGIADMVAMTRAHIADPEIIEKVKQGRVDDIRSCVLTNQGCVGNHWRGRDVRCIHNPATGRERELGIGTVSRATSRKSVAVIGGGVAGMELGRVAALRGYSVDIFEKEGTLGGQVLLASTIPYRQGMLDIVHHLEKQLKKLQSVKISRGCPITKDDFKIILEDYDSVVVATGSSPHVPPTYDGIEPTRVINIKELLEGRIELQDHIAVVDIDWRQNPLGIAEWLVHRGRKVTVISSAYFVGQGIDEVTLASSYTRLYKRARFLPLSEIVSLKGNIAMVRNVLTNEIDELMPIDQVVFVAGAIPNRGNFFDINDTPSNLYYVGDCAIPRGIPEALLAANRLARTL